MLPETDQFKPSGTPESPLAVIDSWVNTTDPATGAGFERFWWSVAACGHSFKGFVIHKAVVFYRVVLPSPKTSCR
jgi:hypothetical protein